MQPDYQQALQHCKLLTGEDNPLLSFRFYYDVDGKEQRPDLAQNFHGTLNESWNRILLAQQNYCAITFTVNQTDGVGAKKENIIKHRAAFIDFDGMDEPEWIIPPSLVNKRDETHGHAYWFLNDNNLNVDSFEQLQKRLQLTYNSDPHCVDATRVLRMCGSIHYKDLAKPAMYTVRSGTGLKHSVTELIDGHMLSPENDADYWKYINSRAANASGSGLKESCHYNAILTNWCSNQAKPAVENSNGNDTLIQVCLYARDRGIPLDSAQDILWEHYNHRCEPPWTEAEKPLFYQTIRNAYHYAQNAPGCLTAESLFKDRGELPAPVEGWDTNVALLDAPVGSGTIDFHDRISRSDAEVLHGNIHIKSSHYDLAQCFDGMIYEGFRIIRTDKVFYVSNGKSWSEVQDDVVKSQIQRFYAHYRPSDTFTRGILNVFCDLVNRPEIRNGMWLNDPKRDGSNVVVFQDGMVNFDKLEGFVLEPHDPEFFTFNECDYNYNCECPTPVWNWFLKSVWGLDQDSIDLCHEYMGYSLTNSLDMQKFMVLIGATRSGKGTITRVMTNVIGSANVCSPSLTNLTKDYTLHIMSSKKVAFIPDAHSVNHSLRDTTLSMLKAMTGGDSVTFDVKYKVAQTSELTSRLVLSTNGMPEFNDPSGALAHRMLVLVFDKSFAGSEDYTLDAKLFKERAGIRALCTEGYVRLRKNGRFTDPKKSKIERQEIQEDMFPLSRFVSACCELSIDYSVSVDELFAVYSTWCNFDGVSYPLTKIQFGKTLRHSSLNLKLTRPYNEQGQKVRTLNGIKINTDLKQMVTHNTRPPFPKVPDHV